MSYQTEFPDFPAYDVPVIPAHWRDTSWHNDYCPFWTIGPDMGVWVDYADPTKREWIDGRRFVVVRLHSGNHPMAHEAPLLETDDWRDVLACEYEARIGYDPFADDPAMTVEEVAATLAEYALIAAELGQ